MNSTIACSTGVLLKKPKCRLKVNELICHKQNIKKIFFFKNYNLDLGGFSDKTFRIGKMSKTSRGGGCIFFWGGVQTIFTYFGGSVYEAQPIRGGVSLNCTRMWGGSAVLRIEQLKMRGVSTYLIKYGLIIEYICYYFAFLGWAHKIFL